MKDRLALTHIEVLLNVVTCSQAKLRAQRLVCSLAGERVGERHGIKGRHQDPVYTMLDNFRN